MRRTHLLKSALIGLGLVGAAGSSASATVLFNSNGFEESAGYTAGLSLVGQPASAPSTDRWDGVSDSGTGVTAPVSGVFAYNPVNPAAGQYAVVQAINNSAGSFGFFYPKRNLPVADGGAGAFVPGVTNSDKAVAITFNMNVLPAAAGSTAANDEFFGVVAYGNGNELASLGLNHRTGQYVLPVGATVINSSPSGLGAAGLNTFHGYELLLDYNTQTWSIYSQLVSGVSPFVLDATGSFASAATNFTDADLAAFNLGTGSATGNAIFDDYLVQSVPEPTSVVVAGAAFGLLLGRRRNIL